MSFSADIIAPTQERSTLDQARNDLAQTDRSLSLLLVDFGAAAAPTPAINSLTPQKLQSLAANFPQDIKDLCIDEDTPIELIAGVSQYIRPEILKSKQDAFKNLAQEICVRHNISRAVYEHKRDNRANFEDSEGHVQTFIEGQHARVVERMKGFCQESGADPKLGATAINFLALANAGFQDQAINQKSGPFIAHVTSNDNIEMRYPEYRLAI